ncbi:hydroxyacylglutathione hydrolase [Vibrio sp. SCSIO 43136]|uniref:hydroxyacylglutathione hydrolase n=1 Tax=Vibrio sp. SCSIO 43136 TaxID=2819101 RepID=UPI002075754A|nr:hydroxyacylglutathione hydrolase [Vibrio sp. SCSIO 43136]USD65924.1 hydroxyacylglutathione hydrolase [Vibrio sp. SCSIO 43136]
MLIIKSIPAFNDNYIWLIQNSDRRCAVVDPGDAAPVLEYLKTNDLQLEAILLTHHHNDHIGGVADLVIAYPDTKVVGPANEPIAAVNTNVDDGDQLDLFGETFLVLGLPGHTKGHIGYYGDGKLFCGDVLFSAGCGRVFEGTFEQMFDSLGKINALAEETEVYCAHEYTAANISFALAVEPDNQLLLNYRDEVIRLRGQEKSTLPTTLRQERWVNPFLRCQEQSVIKAVANRTQDTTPIAVFSALRAWKNEF